MRVDWKKQQRNNEQPKTIGFTTTFQWKAIAEEWRRRIKKKHGNNNTIFLQKNSMMPTLTEWNDHMNGVERLAHSALIYSACKLKILREVLGGLAGRIEFLIEFFRDTKQNDRFFSRG